VKSVMEPIVDRKIKPFVEEHSLPQVVGHCVRWDVLGACIESEYADLCSPGFFTGLMGWYMRGRFPCGWGEVDRDGAIREFSSDIPVTLGGISDIPVTLGEIVERDRFWFADLQTAMTSCGVHPG